MRRKFLIFLNVILVIVIVNMVVILISHLQSPKKELPQNVTEASRTIEELKPDQSPPYAPTWLEWEIALTNDPQSITSIEKNSFLYARGGTLISNLSFSGREWINTTISNTTEELKSQKSVIPHYMDALSENGWKFAHEIAEGKTVKGVAADGANGSVMAYVKQEENDLRVIVLATEINTFECPCTTTIRVFLSDPIPLSKILENYVE